MTRVAVVGTSPVWSRGMATLLVEAGLEPVSLQSLSEWEPGVGGSCIVLHGETAEALEALADFNEEHPHIPVVAIIAEVDVVSAARAIRAGAVTVLSDAATNLRPAIEASVSGNSLLPFDVVGSMAMLVPDDEDLSRWLSEEEMSWLRAMAAGETVADIAESASYSERAMYRQLKSLYVRLGVRNRTEALLWAGQRGILDRE